MAPLSPPHVTLPDGTTGPLTVAWADGGSDHLAVVTAALAGAGSSVVIMLDHPNAGTDGHPDELDPDELDPDDLDPDELDQRDDTPLLWGRLSTAGVRLSLDPRSPIKAALEPLLTFEHTLELLTATNPADHTANRNDQRAHRLTSALTTLPDTPTRAIGLTMIHGGYTGTSDDLLRAVRAATRTAPTPAPRPDTPHS